MTTLESLYQEVEATCNSDAGLLRLVQVLLEHQPKASPAVRDFVSALVYYAFHSRRVAIWKQSGRYLQSPCGINSGYGPITDLERARDYARECERHLLAFELMPEEIQDIKNRVGRLRLGNLLARIRDGRFEVPRKVVKRTIEVNDQLKANITITVLKCGEYEYGLSEVTFENGKQQ